MKKNWLMAVAATVVLAGCATPVPTTRNPLAVWVPSPNVSARQPVLIVLHYTAQHSVEQSLHTLRTANSGGPVSAHYLLGEDGSIYQLVPDELRARHAGVGSWGTIHDVNSASIGIEIDNDGYEEFSEAQVQSLLRLLDDLCKRWSIPRSNIIGHADLAPTRKIDPGVRFPWKRLHEAGFGVWPREDAPPAPAGFDPWRALAQFGYSLADRRAAVRAFRIRFRGIDDGEGRAELDAEDLRILHALTEPAGAP